MSTATVSLLCCGNCHRVAIQVVDIILLAPVLYCIHAERLAEQVPIQDSWEKKRVREWVSTLHIPYSSTVIKADIVLTGQAFTVAILQMITQIPHYQRGSYSDVWRNCVGSYTSSYLGAHVTRGRHLEQDDSVRLEIQSELFKLS